MVANKIRKMESREVVLLVEPDAEVVHGDRFILNTETNKTEKVLWSYEKSGDEKITDKIIKNLKAGYKTITE